MKQGSVQSKERREVARKLTAVALATAAMFAIGVGSASAQAPKSPVTINISDPAGDLALTQAAIDAYQKKHPEMIAKINIVRATAPELPGKLKAMQGAGRSDIDLVLTGTDFLAAGIEQGLLEKILPAKTYMLSADDTKDYPKYEKLWNEIFQIR